MKLDSILENAEKALTDVAARVGPFVAPIPTAYAVAVSCHTHLDHHPLVALAAGLAIETVGIASVSTALTLREYNTAKRKSDPVAPAGLAFGLGGVYLVSAVGLAVAMEVVPGLAIYAPVVFPVLSLCGATILALRADHRQRLAVIVQDKTERASKRVSKRTSKSVSRHVKASVQPQTGSVQMDAQDVQNGVQASNLDDLNVQKRMSKSAIMDKLLDICAQRPGIGPSEIGQELGISRSSVYNHVTELKADNRLSKNGAGWVVAR